MTPFSNDKNLKRFLGTVKDTVNRVNSFNVGAWDANGLNLPEYEQAAPQIYVRIISATFNTTTGVTEYGWQKIEPQNTDESGLLFMDYANVSSDEIEGVAPIISLNPDIPVDGSVITAIQPGQGGFQFFHEYPQRDSLLVEVTEVGNGRIAWKEITHVGSNYFIDKPGGETGSLTVNYAVEPNGATVDVGDRGRIVRGYCPGAKRVKVTYLTAADEASATHAEQVIEIENAAGGTFTLQLDGQTTDPISYDPDPSEIETALNNLTYAPYVTVSGSNPYTITFGDYRSWGPLLPDITSLDTQQLWIYTTSGFAGFEEAPQIIWMEVTGRSGSHYAWKEKEQVSNGSMADVSGGRMGTTTEHFAKEVNGRTDISNGTIVLGKPGFGWNPRVEINTTQEGGITSEIQSIKVLDADGGTYTLSYSENTSPPSYTTTSSLAYNANASTVQTQLRTITGMVDLTVTGNATEADPFLVTFGGIDDQLLLVANQSGLTGAELWTFEYTVPSSSNSTTIPELTVTTSLISENSTTLNGTLNINGIGAQVHNYNGTYTLNQYGGNVSFTYGSYTNMTFNTTLHVNLYQNTTISLFGSVVLTIFGNIVIDSSKQITLPKIVGNKTGNILQAIPSDSSSAGTPGRFQLLNGAIEVTNLTGTPTTPSAGTTGLYIDNDDGLLYRIDSTGTSYPVANTGSGTSAGNQYEIQYSSDGAGNFGAETGFSYDPTTNTFLVPYIRMSSGSGTGYRYLYVDDEGDVTVNAGLTQNQVVYPDNTGKLTGESGFTYDPSGNVLTVQYVRADGLAGTGYRFIYADDEGDLTVNPALTQNQVVYPDNTGKLTGESGFTYDPSGNVLTVSAVRVSGLGGGGQLPVFTDNDGDLFTDQGAAVADATGAGDIVTQFNALLAELRTLGILP